MKIVMRQDVEKVGDKGTVQTVSDGFARNYLIPKGFAVVATPGELKNVEQAERVQARKIAKQEKELQSLADKIDGQRLAFTARASEQGRLFGSVTSGDIAERLGSQIGEQVDRRKVVLDEPIRTTGDHRVSIHLVGRLRPQVTVSVTAEAVDEDESKPESGAVNGMTLEEQGSEAPTTAGSAASGESEEA
jgi:large subunit ribosomal protein L9